MAVKGLENKWHSQHFKKLELLLILFYLFLNSLVPIDEQDNKGPADDKTKFMVKPNKDVL